MPCSNYSFIIMCPPLQIIFIKGGVNMNSVIGENEIPLGLGMAFAQNIGAMEYFSSLDDYKKHQVIDMAHNVQSKQEMRSLVNKLANHEIVF